MKELTFADVGLVSVGDVELFVLHDMNDRTLEILQDESAAFDDDGSDSDGPSWYCELGDLDQVTAATLEAAGLGYRTHGKVFSGYDGSDAQKHTLFRSAPFWWCGYRSRAMVYVEEK